MHDTYSVVLKVTFKTIMATDPPPVSINFPASETKTAFDVLVAAQKYPCYEFTYKNYPQLGAIITSICGIEKNSITNNYWLLFVNDKDASVGVSSYRIKPNDVLEMRYMYVDLNSSPTSYSVTLKVVFKAINHTSPQPVHVNFPQGSTKTAFDVLTAAQCNECYNFTYVMYPNMGSFITSICGVYNNQISGNYWQFLVNGTPASVGVTCYIVQPNDVIVMQYTHFGDNITGYPNSLI